MLARHIPRHLNRPKATLYGPPIYVLQGIVWRALAAPQLPSCTRRWQRRWRRGASASPPSKSARSSAWQTSGGLLLLPGQLGRACWEAGGQFAGSGSARSCSKPTTGLPASAGCVCLGLRLPGAVLCVLLVPGCAGCPAQLVSFILHAIALTRLDLHAPPISALVQLGPGSGGCPAQCAGRMDRGQPGGCAAASGAQNEAELQPAAGVAARPCRVCVVRLFTLSSVQRRIPNRTPVPCPLQRLRSQLRQPLERLIVVVMPYHHPLHNIPPSALPPEEVVTCLR